jgi:PKHD-type hydroxylase
MYRTISGLVAVPECETLARLVRALPSNNGDKAVPGSSSYYNLGFVNILLGRLESRLSELVGVNLRASYSYTRVYKRDDELASHIDRPSCEWSVTLNIAQSDPWPIFMAAEPVTQSVGDGTIYQGCQVTHWRERFEGHEYIQVFLHYVDTDGPHAAHAYDARSAVQHHELHFPFRFPNENLLNTWVKPRLFSYKECQELISQFKNKIEIGQVGEAGGVNFEKRRNKVSWLLKTREYEWVYRRIHRAVTEANSMFKMNLSDISELIQFSVYEVGDYYNWHIDLGTKNEICMRKLSVSVQLSDPGDYDGGRLEFDDEYTEDDIRQGTAVIFPSFCRHRVTAVTRGTRYSLVCWVTGQPFC